MKLFLAIAAVLAWPIGGMMLLIPEQFFAPNGLTMTPLMATVAQVQAQAHGATLVGLGVIDWLARSADRRGLNAVLAGNLVVQILSLLVLLRTTQLVVRFQHSHPVSASTVANVGIKGPLANISL